jgi:quercetin dioxygenase-like cupin family protein
MELIRREAIAVLCNSGVESRQLLSTANSASLRLAITRVTVPPGAVNPLHTHDSSEQVWVLLAGHARLLLGGGRTDTLNAGDVVRFTELEVHGMANSGAAPVEYISVTSPPMDFRSNYEKDWNAAVERSRNQL